MKSTDQVLGTNAKTQAHSVQNGTPYCNIVHNVALADKSAQQPAKQSAD